MSKLEECVTQLNGDDIAVAIEAAELLGQIGGTPAHDALKARFAFHNYMLTNTEEENRLYFTIALVLAEMGSYHEYRTVVDEDAPFVRLRVKDTLESVGKERAIKMARVMFSSNDDGERYWAEQVLATFRVSKSE